MQGQKGCAPTKESGDKPQHSKLEAKEGGGVANVGIATRPAGIRVV